MKRISKRTLAVVVAVMMVLAAFPVTAFAGQSTGDLSGDNTVNDVTINVTVPTNLNFALDPLELNSISSSQITTADYYFINKTLAPVKVSLNLTAKLADGVSLVDSASVLSQDDPSVVDKDLYFAALGAKKVTDNDLDFGYTLGTTGKTDPKGTYDATADTLVPFRAADKGATIEFALDKATDVKDDKGADGTDGVADTLAASDKGVAAFQFYGKMNTYAPWVSKDVTVDGAYTLTALRATTYTNYTTNNGFTADGLNQLKQVVAVGFTDAGSVSATNSKTYTYSTAAVPSEGLTVGFNFAGANFTTKTVSSIKLADNTALTANTDYTVDTDSIVIKPSVLSTLPAGANVLTITVDGQAYTLNISPTDPIGFTDAGGTATSSKTYTYSTASVPSEGLSVGFNFNGKTVTGIKKADNTALTANTDYTVGSSAIVIKSSVLSALPAGATALTITVDGSTYTLNISPTDPIGFTDAGSVSVTNSKTYTYSLAAVPSDGLSVGFNFNGKSVTGIKLADNTALTANTDYTVSSSAIVIKSSVLSNLAAGATALTITVDGQAYTLNVNPTDPIGFTDAGSVSVTNSKTYTYVTNAVPADGLSVGFNFNGKSVTGIKLADNTALTANTDYTVGSSAIVIKSSVLSNLAAGATALTITVDGQAYTLNISPTQPIGFTDAGSVSATESKTYSYSKAIAGDLTVPFNFNSKTITSVKDSSNNALVLNTGYTVGSSSIVIKAAALSSITTGTKVFTIVVDGQTYNLNISLSYGAAGFIVSNAISSTITLPAVSQATVAAGSTGVDIPFYCNGKTVTSFKINGTDRAGLYTVSTNAITMSKALIASFAATGVKTVDIYLDGATTASFSTTFTLNS